MYTTSKCGFGYEQEGELIQGVLWFPLVHNLDVPLALFCQRLFSPRFAYNSVMIYHLSSDLAVLLYNPPKRVIWDLIGEPRRNIPLSFGLTPPPTTERYHTRYDRCKGVVEVGV